MIKRILEKSFSDFTTRNDSGVDGKSVVDGDTDDGEESGQSGRFGGKGDGDAAAKKKSSPDGGAGNSSAITINDLKTLIAIKSGKHPDADGDDDGDEDGEDEDGADKSVTDTGKETSVVVKDPRFK